jgi:hypothetical protein
MLPGDPREQLMRENRPTDHDHHSRIMSPTSTDVLTRYHAPARKGPQRINLLVLRLDTAGQPVTRPHVVLLWALRARGESTC